MSDKRTIVVPRGRPPRACGKRMEGGSCVIDITRVVEAWDPVQKRWQPEIRLCHLHAMEYVTGYPVYMPTHEDKERDMRKLGA